MPLASYVVLSGRPIAHKRETSGMTPHHQVHLRDESGVNYRVPINVKSKGTQPDLLYLVDDDLRHPVTAAVESLGSGKHELSPPVPGGANLDYVRANLFDATRMRSLPPNVDGPENDLQDILEGWLDRAIADPAARMHVFGEPFGPDAEHPDAPDRDFGFTPAVGVHDVHMNQGNEEEFMPDDG